MVQRLHRRLRLRHAARRSAHSRLPRGPLVGALGHRRHRARGQDPGRRLRLGRGVRPLPAAYGSGFWRGVAAAVVFSLIHGYASIDQRANQIVSGTAINMVADGLTALIGNAIWSQGGRTPQLPDERAIRRDQLAVRQRDRRRADHRSDLSAPDLGPRHHHLCRLPAGAAHLLGALQHAFRAASARGRRESGRGRHRRHIGQRHALQRGDHLRRSGRASPASISCCRRRPISSRT